jgi:hypothetical protein
MDSQHRRFLPSIQGGQILPIGLGYVGSLTE